MVPWPPQVIAEDHHTSLQPSGQPAAKKQAEGHGESSHHGAIKVQFKLISPDCQSRRFLKYALQVGSVSNLLSW